MFNYNIFFTKNTYYSETFLRYNYKLIVPAATNYFQMTYPHIKKFNKFLINATMFCWVRVAFRGKGFRLRKFKLANKLTFNFGHSHWSKMALDQNFFFFKKLKRQNYICISKNTFFLNSLKSMIKQVKNLNVYTKRGLRLKRQLIKRRFGKISQVVSSLH